MSTLSNHKKPSKSLNLNGILTTAVALAALAVGGVLILALRSIELNNAMQANQEQASRQIQDLASDLAASQQQEQEIAADLEAQAEAMARIQDQQVAGEAAQAQALAGLVAEANKTQAVIADAMANMNTAMTTLAVSTQQARENQSLRSEEQFDRVDADVDEIRENLHDLEDDLQEQFDLFASTTNNVLESFVTFPIGGFTCWTGDQTGEDIPPGWLAMNGQTVSDPESPYDGQTIPDYNGQSLFVRGSDVSGVIQDDATAVNGLATEVAGEHTHTETRPQNINVATRQQGGNAGRNQSLTTTETSPAGDHTHALIGDDETRPVNVSCVYIIRVK